MPALAVQAATTAAVSRAVISMACSFSLIGEGQLILHLSGGPPESCTDALQGSHDTGLKSCRDNCSPHAPVTVFTAGPLPRFGNAG